MSKTPAHALPILPVASVLLLSSEANKDCSESKFMHLRNARNWKESYNCAKHEREEGFDLTKRPVHGATSLYKLEPSTHDDLYWCTVL